MPTVSVITPTFNRAHMVGNAVQSVLNQTFPDWELIVVDDGSEDNTGEVIAGFQDPRICYIYQENKKLPGARNTGIRASTGTYLAFLDSDDLFLPDKLKVQVAALEKRQEHGLVASGWIEIDAQFNPLRSVRPWLTRPTLTLADWLCRNPFTPPCVLIRRSWVMQVGLFDEQQHYVEDWDLWLRLAYAGCRMFWEPTMVCQYTSQEGSMAHQAERMTLGLLNMFGKFFAQPDLSREALEMRPQAFAHAYLDAACRYYVSGDVDAGRENLDKAIGHWPAWMRGNPPELADLLLGWATSPLTGSPAAFMKRVLDHLPASASGLDKYSERLLWAAAITAAVEAKMVGNHYLARQYLKSAPLASNPDLFIELLIDGMRARLCGGQEEFIRDLFTSLPPELSNLGAFESKALGRLYMARGFEALDARESRQAAEAFWQGICRDPTWLRNRGVWAVILRELLARLTEQK